MGDSIGGHTSAFWGFIVGLAIGLAVGVAFALLVLTAPISGPLLAIGAACVMVGGVVSMGAIGAKLGKHWGSTMKGDGTPCSVIPIGSSDTRIEDQLAARAEMDLSGPCLIKKMPPLPISQGSSLVFVNNKMLVRDTDKAKCGGKVIMHCLNVWIGGPAGGEDSSELPDWVPSDRTLDLLAMGGGLVALAGSVIVFGAVATVIMGGIGMAGGKLSKLGGEWLGARRDKAEGRKDGQWAHLYGETAEVGGGLIAGLGAGKVAGMANARLAEVPMLNKGGITRGFDPPPLKAMTANMDPVAQNKMLGELAKDPKLSKQMMEMQRDGYTMSPDGTLNAPHTNPTTREVTAPPTARVEEIVAPPRQEEIAPPPREEEVAPPPREEPVPARSGDKDSLTPQQREAFDARKAKLEELSKRSNEDPMGAAKEAEGVVDELGLPIQRSKEVNLSSTGPIKRNAAKLREEDPTLSEEAAMKMAADEYELKGMYGFDPKSNSVILPKEFTVMERPPDLSNPTELALAQKHSRATIEEATHALNYNTKPGEFVPLHENVREFSDFVDTPQGKAWLEERGLKIDTRNGVEEKMPHEIDIMELHQRNSTFSETEIARYEIRKAFQQWKAEGGGAAPAAPKAAEGGCTTCGAGGEVPPASTAPTKNWFQRLFSKAIDPEPFGTRGAPHVNDGKQGGIGDCYLIATLQAMAKQRPDLLMQSIKKNPDGSFDVTFNQKGRYEFNPDGTQTYIPPKTSVQRVTPEVPSLPLLGTKYAKQQDGSWVQVYEKAYAQEFGGGKDYKGIGDGGHPTDVMGQMGLGSKYEATNGQSFQQMKSNFDAGDPMVAVTGKKPDVKGLPGTHAYAVKDVYYAPDGTPMVDVLNPWNGGNGERWGSSKYGGDFSMPYDQFVKGFPWVARGW